jgi:hypothetical protein
VWAPAAACVTIQPYDIVNSFGITFYASFGTQFYLFSEQQADNLIPLDIPLEARFIGAAFNENSIYVMQQVDDGPCAGALFFTGVFFILFVGFVVAGCFLVFTHVATFSLNTLFLRFFLDFVT